MLNPVRVELGLSPRARLQLGVTLGDAYRSLDEMHDSLEVDELPQDPRLLVDGP